MIETDHPSDCQGRVWKVLEKWVQMNGNEATVGSLKNALEEIERKDVAQKLVVSVPELLNCARVQSGSAQREVEQLEMDVEKNKESLGEMSKQIEELNKQVDDGKQEIKRLKEELDKHKNSGSCVFSPAGRKFTGKYHGGKNCAKGKASAALRDCLHTSRCSLHSK
ncbi:hypothetical protein AWC38_SpisGene6829 [Stylophora pistillata]|uniref:Death domain-containing protein n=2 Tax=Stylophora pistillata TaxID=50429 RepID=A0A2B4SJ00_STYPI|nr:hypothetical protein AWC38_SpisGene6829 [Stylophora pistillata]